MAIEFSCVLCGKTLRIDDKFGGKMVQCPACKGKVNAPLAGGQPAPEAPHEPPPQYQAPPPPPPPQYTPPPPPQYAPPSPPPPAYSAPPAYQPQAYQPPPQQYAPPQQQYQQPQSYQAPPQYQAPPAAHTPQGVSGYSAPSELSPPSKTSPLPINVIFICLFSIVGGFFFQGWIFIEKGPEICSKPIWENAAWFYYIELLIYAVMCSGIIVGGVLLLERNALGWLLCFFGSLGAMVFGLGMSVLGAMAIGSGAAGVMLGFGNALMFIGFPFVIWFSVKRPNFKGYFVRLPDRSDRRK